MAEKKHSDKCMRETLNYTEESLKRAMAYLYQSIDNIEEMKKGYPDNDAVFHFSLFLIGLMVGLFGFIFFFVYFSRYGGI
jgi:hypothetical protein